jgi:predicted  nucleic acid-binding Zn-ribbon protein
MLPTLEHLLVLQDRDRRIASLKAELARIPGEMAAVQKRVQDEAARLEAAKHDLKQIEADRKKLEIDAEAKRAQITKYKQQLFQIKSNTEYQALLKEIANAEQEIAHIEDIELEFMEKTERLQPALKEEQTQLKEVTAKGEAESATLRQRSQAAERELAELRADREKLAAAADADLLSRYDRLMKSKGDFAIVQIVHGNCGGCHLNLPPQVVHNAKNGDGVVSCDYCGRILYWPAQ